MILALCKADTFIRFGIKPSVMSLNTAKTVINCAHKQPDNNFPHLPYFIEDNRCIPVFHTFLHHITIGALQIDYASKACLLGCRYQ